MDRKNAILTYLLGAFGQIVAACIMVLLFKNKMPLVTELAIIVGGISTALWGIVVSKKYKGVSIKKILLDFINIKMPYRYYLLMLVYLVLDFCYIIIGGTIKITDLYTPIILFLNAIVFGGIEEIGWRYTFQPILEEKINFTFSTVITFTLWGIWHFLFFYIDGTIFHIQVIPFLIGLLTNCFILAFLFKVTKRLSICVITHALINMLAQIAYGGNEVVSVLCSTIIIAISIIISVKNKK